MSKQRAVLPAVWMLLWALTFPAFLAGQNVELNVVERSLKNGMKILLVERHDSPTVALYLRFRVGGVDDPRGQTGIAHLLEHMMFKGTKIYGTTGHEAEVPLMEKIDRLYAELEQERLKAHSPFEQVDEAKIARLEQEMSAVLEEQRQYVVKDEMWQTYQRLGGVSINASTGQDSTQYFVQLPSNQLEVWAFVEADRIANPVFREFYPERDVVHEERRMRTDTRPQSLLWETFNAAAYQVHPYRNPVVGWASDIDNMRREEVLEYFRTFYAPNNAIAAIVGDIDPDKTMAIMEKYFGPLPAQPQPRRTVSDEPQQQAELRVLMEMDAQPQLLIGYHIPRLGHPDGYALDVMAQLLSGVSRSSRTGRLYKNLILDQKVALEADASSMTPLYQGLFVLSAAPAPGKTAAEVEKAIYAEIEKLQKEPPTGEEMARVRNGVDAYAIRSLRSNFGIARAIASAEHLAGTWRYILTEREKLKAVTAEDVQRVAKEYFGAQNRTVAELRTKSREGGDAPERPSDAGRQEEERQEEQQ